MSNVFGLPDNDLATIIEVLSLKPEINKAYIFGSRAKGNFKKGSDVDIALKGNLLNYEIINQISYFLNEETLMPYTFDILNYDGITNADLLEHIDRVGIEFYSR